VITRRQFLKASSLAGVGLFLPLKGASAAATIAPRAALYARPTYEAVTAAALNLTRWLDKLPIPPALTPDTMKYPGKDYYEISMEQKNWQFHNDLAPRPSWGYWSGSSGIGYLGPTIVAQQGRPVVVKYTNNRPYTHLLHDSIDWTLHPDEAVQIGLNDTPHHGAVRHQAQIGEDRVHAQPGLLPILLDADLFDGASAGDLRDGIAREDGHIGQSAQGAGQRRGQAGGSRHYGSRLSNELSAFM
jgi:hypothetical protein